MVTEEQPNYMLLNADDVEDLARWARLNAHPGSGVWEYRMGARLVVSKDDWVHIEIEPRVFEKSDTVKLDIEEAIRRAEQHGPGDFYTEYMRRPKVPTTLDHVIQGFR